MKLKIVVLLLSILSGTFSFAQKKNKKKAPPGTVQINDTLFVDRTEVANVHWREYLFYLERYDSVNAYKALPDTLCWRSEINYTEPIVEYYFRHPSFNDYPVVGISYEQAIEFCKWRSDRVNELNSKRQENKKPFKNVTYRLLTKQEWEKFAAGDYNVVKHPFGYDSVYKKWKSKYSRVFNYKYEDNSSLDSLRHERRFYTAPVRSFWPNSNKLYNTIGNVAEMVAEKGIAKGGSFFHELEDCKITNDLHYIKPEMWLGFRCMAVIVK